MNVGIPEILISRIQRGDNVAVRFDAIQNQEFSATVTEVGVSTAGFATTYPVMVTLNESNSAIRAGMAAEVAFSFASADQRERFVVPSVSVGEDRTGRFVFIIQPNEPGIGVAEKRAVTVGGLDSEGMEIKEGLDDGDYLVTAGVSKLQNGQEVRFEASKED